MTTTSNDLALSRVLALIEDKELREKLEEVARFYWSSSNVTINLLPAIAGILFVVGGIMLLLWLCGKSDLDLYPGVLRAQHLLTARLQPGVYVFHAAIVLSMAAGVCSAAACPDGPATGCVDCKYANWDYTLVQPLDV